MLHFYKKNYRIGLDVDEVCANFLEGYSTLTGKDYKHVRHFNFAYDIQQVIDAAGPDFWLNLPPKFAGADLTFVPTCYISTRSFDTCITQQWLEKNNFPCVPVIHVKPGDSKIEVAKKMQLDVFVDDFIKNFQELNANGIKTLLMDCTHNRQYNVEPCRIFSLYDVPNKITELGW